MRQRQWFIRLTLLSVVLALTIGAVLMQLIQSSTVTALQSNIDSYSSVLTGLRLGTIGMIALIWPKLIQLAEQSNRTSKERRAELYSWRWRIAGWLLLIELLLGQNIIWRSLQELPWIDV